MSEERGNYFIPPQWEGKGIRVMKEYPERCEIKECQGDGDAWVQILTKKGWISFCRSCFNELGESLQVDEK